MRKPKEHTTLRCTGGCPFAWFSQNQAGGTSHYGCKIDPGVSVSEDDFAACKASLEVLENHPMADIFFKDIILAKREERQENAKREARERELIDRVKEMILDLIGGNRDFIPLVRRACDEIEGN